MTVRLSTTVSNIDRIITNKRNVELIVRFFGFMKKIGTSERYQNNNLKAIIAYSKLLGPSITLDEIKSKSQITSFLDTKIKAIEQDPDKRWITTWNDYLGRIKYFYRWLHNYDDNRFDDAQFSDWDTPDFVRIKQRKTKRISPYLENELWEKEDLLRISNMCFYCREKSGIHMDHVIPFNFIFQTELFNMVPACQECNSNKNDRLPEQRIFDLVKERNEKLLLKSNYTDDWYQKLYDNCVTNYQGRRPYFSSPRYLNI